MMTALLSVGAWATEIWNEGATLNWNYFTLPKMSMTAGDVLTFHITSVGAEWSTMTLITTDETKEGWDKRGTELMNLDHRSGSNVIVVVTDDIASAAPDGIIVYGENNVVVSSVDYEKKPSSYNLFSGSETITWSSEKGLSSALFAGVQAGDLLKIEISAVGGSEYGDDVQLRSSSWGGDETILKSAKAYSATTVTFEFDDDLVTAAKTNGLYIRGNSFTMTSVDIVYTYAVTIAGSITNGTVTASKSKAAYGETVTLTATPAAGYALVKPTVTDENSDNVAVTDNGDGTYSFTMPATAVTVNATFTSATALSTDRLIIYNKKGGSIAPNGDNSNYRDLWVDDDEYPGWDLTVGRPVTTDEFAGIQVLYRRAMNIKMQVVYGDDDVWTSGVITGEEGSSHILSVNFADKGITGVVKSIKFFRNSSADTMIQFESTDAVSLKTEEGASASTPTSSLTLTYETLEDGGGSSVTYVPANSEFTITSGDGHWAGWIFTLPIPTTLYKGVNFNMTSVPENGAIEITYEGAATQTVKLTTGNNIVNFVHGGNITQIKFNVAGTYRMGECSASNTYLAKVTAAKYATYGAVNDAIDYSTAAPSGLKAYIAYVEDNKVKLTEVSKVPANTAVILYADVETTTEYTLSTTAGTNDDVSANKLHISDGSTVTGDANTIYVLANGTSGVGFYLLQSGDKLAAGKAYLVVSGGVASARQFIGFGDDNETTGITMVQGEGFMVNGSDNYYDLQGRRVAQPTKGLYVVNGKKVIIK